MEKGLVVITRGFHFDGMPIGMVRDSVYELDSFKFKYPYFDLKNKEYFKIVTKNILEKGTPVLYCGQKYVIVSDPVSYLHTQDGGGKVVVKYYIAKNINVRKKYCIEVFESELRTPELYYFINSKGEVCEAAFGVRPDADDFRKASGNMFKIKDLARRRVAEIKSRKY